MRSSQLARLRRNALAGAVAVAAALCLIAALAISASAATPPTQTANPASEFAYTTAHVSGTVNPNAGGLAMPVYFEYKEPSAAGWGAVFAGEVTEAEASGSSPIPFAAELTGLKPGAEYEVRLTTVFEGAELFSPEPNPKFTTEAVTPPTVTIEAPTAVAGTTAHFSGHINPNAPAGPLSPAAEAAYKITYRFQCTPACPGLEGEIAADSTSHEVSAEATGLQPGTAYEVSLIAENASGPQSAGPEAFTTTAAPPTIANTFAGAIGSEVATLNAEISPEAAPTSYHFEFSTDEGFSAPTKVPATDPVIPATPAVGTGTLASGSRAVSHLQTTSGTFEVGRTLIGQGIQPGTVIKSIAFGTLTLSKPATGKGTEIQLTTAVAQIVSEPLLGLAPDTTYYYRLVASNEESPPGGTPGPTLSFRTLPQAGAGSDSCPNAAFRIGLGAELPDCRAYAQVSPVEKNQSAAVGRIGNILTSASGDRTTFVSLNGFPGIPGLQEYPTYLASFEAGSWSSQGLAPAAEGVHEYAIKGYSADLRYAVIEASADLAPGASAGSDNFYIYDSVTHAYSTIGERPAGEESQAAVSVADSQPGCDCILLETRRALLPEAEAGIVNLYILRPATGALTLVNQEPTPEGVAAGSGSRFGAYTHDSLSADGSRVTFTDEASGQVFERVNGSTTIAVSAPDPTAPPQPLEEPRSTWRAETPSGRFVFFTSGARLTEDSTASTGRPDLYRFDAIENQLQDLTTNDPSGADVLGTLEISDDGSFAYFVASSVQAQGADPSSCCNLYVWHDGDTRTIATLEGVDEEDWLSESSTFPGFAAGGRASRVSPSGAEAIFMSHRPLNGYDNAGLPELYHYDYASESLACVSCNPSRARATSPSFLTLSYVQNAAPAIAHLLDRNLSADGKEVFFNSEEALVPQDTNAQMDVYEWKQEGSGGSLHLISTGRSPLPSYFGDASADGSRVFFFTSQGLVGQDRDQISDLYDADVGGELAQSGAQPSAGCMAGSCPAEQPAPPAGPLGSESVRAAGGNQRTSRSRQLQTALRRCRAKKEKKQRIRCEKKVKSRYRPRSAAQSRSKADRGVK